MALDGVSALASERLRGWFIGTPNRPVPSGTGENRFICNIYDADGQMQLLRNYRTGHFAAV